mmetsp:Transcript_19744/g.48914  ORF Transcript_19744/g.48914 Transcript_19744/m.48914 type:complete len:233 (+) Transcript_19744:3942-4640(+)
MSSLTEGSTREGLQGSVATPVPWAGRASRKDDTAAEDASRVLASAVRLVTEFWRDTTAARIRSRSPTTPSQSVSMRFVSTLRYSSCARPPMSSSTYPATESMASSRPAATECPPPCTRDSMPERDSSTSCLNTSRSSSLDSSIISAIRSCISPAWSAVDLPRSTRYAATSVSPRMDEVKGEREKPPVVAPMVWSKSTKLRLEVPMRCMARHHSGTKGIRSMGTECRSMRCSA